MKKEIIFIIITIFLCLCLCSCREELRLPRADNTTTAESIITHVYPDEMFSKLDSGEYRTLYEVAEDFEIECIRDPSVFYENYLPYIVLLSESGRRAFIFYGDSRGGYDKYDIANCMIVDKFFDYDYMALKLQQMKEGRPSYQAWLDLYMYFTGVSTAGKGTTQCVAVKEGVFVVPIYNGEYPEVGNISFYSDEELFHKENDKRDSNQKYVITPLLSIDKRFGTQ